MGLKLTLQGALIYASMAAYLLAFFLYLAKSKAARVVYLGGFVLASISWIYRLFHVEHIPMQTMFEVFLTMGVIVWPLTQFCRRFLKVGLPQIDMLLGFVLLFPAGFIAKFTAEPQALPPALQSPLFAPHVAVYMLSYVILAKAALQGMAQLVAKNPVSQIEDERATYSLILLGFPFLTLGMLLGSWWGMLAWGDWWGWDPKELWSLATWLVYLIYFHWRYMFGRKYLTINSLLAITGLVAVVITLLWVNLSSIFKGMHNYAG